MNITGKTGDAIDLRCAPRRHYSDLSRAPFQAARLYAPKAVLHAQAESARTNLNLTNFIIFTPSSGVNALRGSSRDTRTLSR